MKISGNVKPDPDMSELQYFKYLGDAIRESTPDMSMDEIVGKMNELFRKDKKKFRKGKA